MNFPTVLWIQKRKRFSFLLLSFLIITVVLIMILERKLLSGMMKRVLLIRGGNKSKSTDSERISRHCKKYVSKEGINWNYFYYYEDIRSKRSLIWCKVPKAGSTTLTKMFLKIAAGGKGLNNNNTRIHKLLRQYYPRQSSKIMKQRLHSSKTFMVVRDPFERILSAYRDKLESYQRDLEFRDGYYYEHYGKFMVQSPNNEINNGTKRKEPTWNEFVNYLLKTSVARYDEHWMPITRLCSPCNVDYNIIIKLEHFDKEIKKPLRYAKINESYLGWSHKTGTGSNRKLLKAYFKKLSLIDVKKLYVKYKRDFQLFGYSPYRYFRLFDENSNSPNNANQNTEIINSSNFNYTV